MKTNNQLSRLQRITNLLLAVLVALICALPVAAGNGTFRNGRYKFCVSVRFNATAAQLAQIRTAFTNASAVLLDATDGQQQFDTITIVNDSGASESAEYWVNAGGGRAYATYGQYGVRGQHVMLYFNDNFQASNGADGDAYTIAHEHAHHSFGVADEYSGSAGAAECAPTPDTATLAFCLMDNYFTRGGRASGGGYTLNEFCVSTNHDPDNNTFQESINHQSCWETIAAHPKRAAAAPTALPTDAAPAAGAVTFRDGISALRTMLVIDRSGSMNLENRMTFAKEAGKIFIDFLQADDNIGLVDFDDSITLDADLGTANTVNKAAIKAQIDSLFARGNTNIGDALQAALNRINAQPDRSCNQIIVLLTDGDHNTGTPPANIIPALQDGCVSIFAVGLGVGISAGGQATLLDLATQTGGRYVRVTNSVDLIGLFMTLAAESTGSGLLTRSPLPAGPNQTLQLNVPIEAGTALGTFSLAFSVPNAPVTISLRDPAGNTITPANVGANVEFLSEANSLVLRITNPAAGNWTIIAQTGGTFAGTLQALAFGEHDGVTLDVGLNNDTLVFPTPMQIVATLRFNGESIVGATMQGTVTRPNGTTVPIQLFDDGRPEHFDVVANDGSYSGRFSNYNENGTYTVNISGTSTAASMTYGGEELFASSPPNATTVPTFTRSATASAVVSNVTAQLEGDVNSDGVVNCVDLGIVRTAFGRRSNQAGYDIRADVNLDSVVDIRDLSFVAQRLPIGTSCP